MSPQPPPLAALPPPGLPLHSPNSTTHTPLLLHFKDTSTSWSIKSALTITNHGSPYLTAREEQRREMVFRTPTSGEEVLRVIKQVHKWSGKEEYFGKTPEGREAWRVKVHRGWKGAEYGLTIFPSPNDEQAVLVQPKVLDQEWGMCWNGHVVATMSVHEKWKHMRREDVLNVAPGMDILLAVGMCYVRIEREQREAGAAGVANAGVSGAVVVGAI